MMARSSGSRAQQCLNPQVEEKLRQLIGQPVIMVTVKERIRGTFVDIRCPYFVIQPEGLETARMIRTDGIKYVIPA